jgi:hypothetical protein
VSGVAPWWAIALLMSAAGGIGIGLAMWEERRDRKPHKPAKIETKVAERASLVSIFGSPTFCRKCGVVPRAHGWAAAIEHSEAAMRAVSTVPPPRIEARPGYEGGPAADVVWGWSAAARDAEVAGRARLGGYVTGAYIHADTITGAHIHADMVGSRPTLGLPFANGKPTATGKDEHKAFPRPLTYSEICDQTEHLLSWGGTICLRCDQRVENT